MIIILSLSTVWNAVPDQLHIQAASTFINAGHLCLQAICSKAAVIPDAEGGPSDADKELLGLLAGLPFLENSRPVHRQLLSSLQRLPPGRFSLFQDLVLNKVTFHRKTNILTGLAR